MLSMLLVRQVAIVVTFGICVVAGSPVDAAEGAPVFVIPGRTPGPIVINQYDARWAVVEGDFGLSRPGHGTQIVIGGRYVGPRRQVIRSYYPTSSQKPELGRHEIEPSSNRELPKPAEDFSRNWSTKSSEPVPPADLPNPNAGPEGVPANPPIVVVPQIGPRRSH
jgi:hypothetical protein